MTQSQLAELSKLLYSPVTLALYVTAATRSARCAHARTSVRCVLLVCVGC